MRKITVAIPHYNNSNFMKDTLEPIVNDDRVSEIIICDDKSSDLENLEKLLKEYNSSKIKLYKNEVNLGSYHNKINTISKCSNECAILLDSDNVIDSTFLDTLYKLEKWDTTRIYAPVWAHTFPHADNGYSPHLKFTEYKNMTIGPKEFIQHWNKTTFKCLSNDCNYFAPVRQFVQCMKQYKYERKYIDSLDSSILFSDWLYNENRVFVVDDLIYKHRLHAKSNYVNSPARRYEREVNEYMIKRMKEKA